MGWKDAVNQTMRGVTGYELRKSGDDTPAAPVAAAKAPPAAARASKRGAAPKPGAKKDTGVSLVLNQPEHLEDERTYVVMGSRRGGTSMVAGMARALGLHLGEVGANTNNEDPAFQGREVQAMRAEIKRRNAERAVWGWKYPAAVHYLPDLLAHLHNPYFIVVYRDPVAASFSQQRLDRPQSRRTVRAALHESSINSSANTSFVLAMERPSLLVSIERAYKRPEVLLHELAGFLGAPAPTPELEARILEYVAPGSYKKFEDYFPETRWI